MSNISAECVLKTAPDTGLEQYSLITLKVEVPYYVWTEILTHKRFARNATSNRAMKVSKNTQMGCYTPDAFYLQGEGMASGYPVGALETEEAYKIWEATWKYCKRQALKLEKLGVAKEQSSRVLPTFKMMRGLLTGTQSAWNAFIEIRNTEFADKAMREFALKASDAIKGADTSYFVFHFPFIETENFFDKNKMNAEEMLYIGAGRIARISYGQPGAKDSDYHLGTQLRDRKHLSPFEHMAGWIEYPRASAICSKDGDKNSTFGWENARASFER